MVEQAEILEHDSDPAAQGRPAGRRQICDILAKDED